MRTTELARRAAVMVATRRARRVGNLTGLERTRGKILLYGT